MLRFPEWTYTSLLQIKDHFFEWKFITGDGIEALSLNISLMVAQLSNSTCFSHLPIHHSWQRYTLVVERFSSIFLGLNTSPKIYKIQSLQGPYKARERSTVCLALMPLACLYVPDVPVCLACPYSFAPPRMGWAGGGRVSPELNSHDRSLL